MKEAYGNNKRENSEHQERYDKYESLRLDFETIVNQYGILRPQCDTRYSIRSTVTCVLFHCIETNNFDEGEFRLSFIKENQSLLPGSHMLHNNSYDNSNIPSATSSSPEETTIENDGYTTSPSNS